EWAAYGADHPLLPIYEFQLIRIGKLPPWYQPKKEYVPTDDDVELADTILDYWTSFAANGHMDDTLSPPWPAVTPERDTAQILRVPVESRAGYKDAQLDFWDELVAKAKHK
ncbi:hypothetical protein ACFL1X_10555, partial [Candidatus Hydrogenedentota bacterium]